MDQIDTIIWDWNGTLLDDVTICIESINQLLSDRKLPTLTRKKYLDQFDFPVQEYYQRIGFDFNKEPFKIPADQFIKLYQSKLPKARLHSSTKKTLDYFSDKKYRQFILSAAEETKLKEVLDVFDIMHYFDQVIGLHHDYATSKIDLGLKLLKDYTLTPETTCLIGDTVHDYEVAKALKCQCILIANGHHPADKLKATNTTIVPNIEGLSNYL